MLSKTEPWRVALLDAADLIEERGHAKFTIEDAEGRMCVWGAIMASMKVSAFSPASYEPMYRLRDFLVTSGQMDAGNGRSWDGPVPWNNAPERTQEEVIAALRGAALAPETV